jgi:hypothetical protein
MAEVTLIGGLVAPLPNQALASQGVSEVYSGNIFPVVVAGIGGLASPLLPNALPATDGSYTVIPGVRQGVLAAFPGGLVDFTEWVWKIRYPPWCGCAPPVVRRLSVWLTPQSNDPTGREVRLGIEWGDGTVTERCVAGQRYQHDFASMGRYTLTVRAVNTLGDGMAVQRDVVVVEYPDSEQSWRWGQSPGSLSTEAESSVE